MSAADHDGDGVPDDVDDDDDGDGLSDAQEAEMGTHPRDADSDDDGLSDGKEDQLGTDPNNPDTDFDGVQDGTEFGNTEPLRDTRLAGFVPDADPAAVTDPRNPDTDGDGLQDGEEDANANGRVDPGEMDPLDPTDGLRDSDGLIDRDERLVYGTDPFRHDSDADQLDDGLEVLVHYTDPLRADTDGDGASDGPEVLCGTDPNDPSDFSCDAVQCDSACDCYGLGGFAFGVVCDGGVGRWRCTGGRCVAGCGQAACEGCGSCTDPDGDGFSSFVETVCGTNPVDPDSVPHDGLQDADHDGIPACRDGDDAGAP